MQSKRKNIIIRESEFDKAFSNFFNDEHKHIRQFLNKKAERPFKEDFTYRVYNHWEAHNLLDTDRGKKGGGWRRFSIIDIIWINIISRLRKFGVSIENIKKVKNSLSNLSQDKLGQFPQLEFFVTMFFCHKYPFYLLVFESYEAELVTPHQLVLSETSHQLDNFIRINIHNIIQKMYPKKDLTTANESILQLNEQESVLLFEIRTGLFKEMVVRMKDKKIIRLDGKVANPEKKLHKILMQKNYDTITMTRADGEILDIQQTILKKL